MKTMFFSQNYIDASSDDEFGSNMLIIIYFYLRKTFRFQIMIILFAFSD
jgi:hypothetical protein